MPQLGLFLRIAAVGGAGQGLGGEREASVTPRSSGCAVVQAQSDTLENIKLLVRCRGRRTSPAFWCNTPRSQGRVSRATVASIVHVKWIQGICRVLVALSPAADVCGESVDNGESVDDGGRHPAFTGTRHSAGTAPARAACATKQARAQAGTRKLKPLRAQPFPGCDGQQCRQVQVCQAKGRMLQRGAIGRLRCRGMPGSERAQGAKHMHCTCSCT